MLQKFAWVCEIWSKTIKVLNPENSFGGIVDEGLQVLSIKFHFSMLLEDPSL